MCVCVLRVRVCVVERGGGGGGRERGEESVCVSEGQTHSMCVSKLVSILYVYTK